MTKAELNGLNTGDIIKGATGNVYVVLANYGSHITAVRTVDVTNESEWSLVAKASHKYCNAGPALGQAVGDRK